MCNILIVDDDTGVRNSLVFHFEDYGFSVDIAKSGEDAQELILSGKFDIAIVDLRLPKLRGDDFIKNVYYKSGKTKFIIFTGSEEYEMDHELKDFDRLYKEVIYKPIEDLTVLNSIIDKLLGT